MGLWSMYRHYHAIWVDPKEKWKEVDRKDKGGWKGKRHWIAIKIIETKTKIGSINWKKENDIVEIVKNPGPEGQALFYPKRGFALLEVHWFIEISNNKSQKKQTNNNDQNSKSQTKK